MAFPQVAASSHGNSAASLTSHTINLPTGIEAGDLLVVAFCSDGANVTISVNTPASGWTELFHNNCGTAGSPAATLAVFYRVADGNEAETITIGTSALEGGAYACYRISGTDGTLESGTAAQASSVSPDPPSLNPAGWGTEDTLWIVVAGWDNGTVALSAYPTDYSSNQVSDAWNNSGGSAVAIATRELAAASEDPGAFTIPSEQWCANTIAVRPGAANAPPVVTPSTTEVSVATTSGGSPLNEVELFPDVTVTDAEAGSLTATLVIADVTKADLTTASVPAGWTESPTGTWTASSRSAAQMQDDLLAMVVAGVAVGSTTATLTVSDGSLTDEDVITLLVVAADLTIAVDDGDTFDFGDVAVDTPTSHQFTLNNNGTSSLVLGTLAITGTGFSIDAGDDPSGDTVAAGNSTTVTVDAEFATSGAKTGEMSIPSNDADSPYVINLTANVPDATSPTASAAVTNGTETVITFTDDSVPLTGTTGMVLKADGNSVAISDYDWTGDLELTLTHATIYDGATVTLTYAPGDVEDALGNALEAFSDMAVTNESEEAAPAGGGGNPTSSIASGLAMGLGFD